MGDLILITKEDCSQCDWVKERIPEGLNVKFLDSKSVDGMVQLSYYEKYDEKQSMPVFIVEDEELAIDGTIAIKNKMIEVNKKLYGE